MSRPAYLMPYIDCRCPECGHTSDDYTTVEDDDTIRPTKRGGETRSPISGSISVCLACAAPSVFEEDRPGHFLLRELSEDEWVSLPGETLQQLAIAQRVCREVRKDQEALLIEAGYLQPQSQKNPS